MAWPRKAIDAMSTLLLSRVGVSISPLSELPPTPKGALPPLLGNLCFRGAADDVTDAARTGSPAENQENKRPEMENGGVLRGRGGEYG